VRALEAYVDERTAGPLFITSAGRRLDRTAAWRLVRRLARAAGIAAAEQISPHSARHAFGTGALDAGVPLRDVQDAMGHADPRTTRRYDRSRQPRSPRHLRRGHRPRRRSWQSTCPR
jgi:integrase/recombinase XerD